MTKKFYILLMLIMIVSSCAKHGNYKQIVYTDSIYTPHYSQLPEADKTIPYNATEFYTRKGLLKKLIYKGKSKDITFEKRNKIEKGRITQTKHIQHWKNDTIYELFFYDNDKQTGYAKANSRGSLLYIEKITYNNYGVDSINKVEYNVPSGYVSHIYDSTGKLTGMNESSFMGKIETARRYAYYPNDSLAKLKVYKWGFVNQVTYFEYDSLNRLNYKLDSNFSNKLRTEVFLTHDDHDMITSKKFIQNVGERSKELIIEMKREFNDNGDWVSRTELVNGDTARVLKRTISYWKF